MYGVVSATDLVVQLETIGFMCSVNNMPIPESIKKRTIYSCLVSISTDSETIDSFKAEFHVEPASRNVVGKVLPDTVIMYINDIKLKENIVGSKIHILEIFNEQQLDSIYKKYIKVLQEKIENSNVGVVK